MDFNLLINDWKVVWVMMAILVFIFTNVCKIPIKHFTNKISNERKRKIVNTTILLLPFLFAFVLNYIYCTFISKAVIFYVADCIRYAFSGIAIYGFVERFFKVKIDNPYETTEEGKNIVEGVTELSSKTTKDQKDVVKQKEETEAIEKFYDKLHSKD